MTFTELVEDTRPETDRQLLERWADTLERLNSLEARLQDIEEEVTRRGLLVRNPVLSCIH